MQTTANYGLKKPEGSDVVDVQNFNDNADTIDAELKKRITTSDYTRQAAYAVDTGTANTYVVTLNPAPTALIEGMCIVVKIKTTSTGTSTLNVNGLGAKAILDSLGNAITSGGLKAGIPYTLRYNGTSFIVQGKGGGGNATAPDLLSGKTANVDSGPITGSMPNNGAVTITPGTTDQAISLGYHNGQGKVVGDANLQSPYILKGKSIFNIAGSYDKIYGIGDNLAPTKIMPISTDITTLYKLLYTPSDSSQYIAVSSSGIYGNSNSMQIFKMDYKGNIIFTVSSTWISGLCVSQDDSIIATFDYNDYSNEAIDIRSTSTGKIIKIIPVPGNQISSIAIDSKKYVYFFAGTANSMSMYKVNTSDGTTTWSFTLPSTANTPSYLPRSLVIDSNEQYIYYVSGTSIVKVNCSTGSYTVFTIANSVDSIIISNDGAYAYVWLSTASILYKYSTSDFSTILWSATNIKPHDLCINADDTYIYGQYDEIIYQYNTSDGTKKNQITTTYNVINHDSIQQGIYGELIIATGTKNIISRAICDINGYLIKN